MLLKFRKNSIENRKLCNIMKEESRKLTIRILKFLSRIVESSGFLAALTWVYAPIVAGMLFWMATWMAPLAFTSYYLFYFLGIEKDWMWNLISLMYKGYTPRIIALLVFEILLIIIGGVLFLWGFIHIVIIKAKKKGLATTGIYKYLRHPQHLGLILISFAFALYVPETLDQGIYVCELLSWGLSTLVLFLWSDLEERHLAKKFGDEFDEYRRKTGSFFPRIIRRHKEKKSFYEINYWKRYVITLFVFVCFVLFMYVISLPSLGLFVPTIIR